MPPTNRAAYLLAEKAKTLTVREAPYTAPGPNELVIRTSAVAINPVDWIVQQGGSYIYPWLKYPCVLGTDAAGTVVEVGSAVTNFAVGDRVTGLAVGSDKRSNRNAEGAFQEYVVLRDVLTAKLPDPVSFEQGAALPLGLSTAACAMYMPDFLALRPPVADPEARKLTGQTLLVWGGSTSVGCNAVQLAVASGYEVVATASPRNFAMLQRLGAAAVFDYRSPTVTRDIVAFLKSDGRTCAGAVAIGAGSTAYCLNIVGSVPKPAGLKRKFVAETTGPMGNGWPSTTLGMLRLAAGFMQYTVSTLTKVWLKGVQRKIVWGSDLMANEVGELVYNEFLQPALANGQFVPMPEVEVVGKGLDKIQIGFAISEAGVSAKKVVVSL